MLHNKIKTFLLNRGWVAGSSGPRFVTLTPPAVLGFPIGYDIAIPQNDNFKDFEQFINNLFEVISSIYDFSVEDLKLVVEQEQAILSVRIYDEYTADGKISLNRFDIVIDKIRAILLNSADFVVNGNMELRRTSLEAKRYLELCQFIETQKGSFIAKIKLPKKQIIKDQIVFERDEIYASEVNLKLINVLEFVNREIFNSLLPVDVTDEYIVNNEENINLKLLKEIENFYANSDIKNVDFSFFDLDKDKIITSSSITKTKLYFLNRFITDVNERLIERINLVFRGKITSLKSKDPDGSGNEVKLAGIYEHLQVIATAILDSEYYKMAIEAHRYKQYITIKGFAVKTKTHLKFRLIEDFVVEE